MRAFVVALALSFAPSAFAGVMAEPNIGLVSGNLIVTSGPTTVSSSHRGFIGGLRLAYRMGALWTGLDASMISGNDTKDSSAKITETDIGLILGYDVNNKLRLFGGFVPMSTMNVKVDPLDSTYTGTAIKFGFGTFLTPKWVLNAELFMKTFTKQTINGTDVVFPADYKVTAAPILLTVGYVF